MTAQTRYAVDRATSAQHRPTTDMRADSQSYQLLVDNVQCRLEKSYDLRKYERR